MFPAEKAGEWEPLKIRERKVTRSRNEGAPNPTDGDTEMLDGNNTANGDQPAEYEEEIVYEEDATTDEGAVYPLHEGRVVNWSCLFALMTHIYNTLSPPFHTPILVISQPAWTAQDHETLTQFFFEKFKTPAFCLMDSALAVCYAYAVSTATVLDVGYEKCDITAVSDFLVHDIGRGVALAECGGESMTQRLLELLGPKRFTRDMCEQLKRSGICEILPPGTALPGEAEVEDVVINPAAAASTGANAAGLKGRGNTGNSFAGSRGQDSIAEAGIQNQEQDLQDGEDNEGVLDVATIVASGKTSEFLARKQKEKEEKAEKAAAKKAAIEAASAPKLSKQPNSKRVTASFHYNERRPLEDLNGDGKRPVETESTVRKRPAESESTVSGESKRQRTPEAELSISATTDVTDLVPVREEKRRNREGTALVRRDIEVGAERFQAGSGGILEQVADATHRCILSVPEVGKRAELWDNLIIVGNGSKVRGKDGASTRSTIH